MANEVAKVNPFGGKVAMADTAALAAAMATSVADSGGNGALPEGTEYMSFSGKTGAYTLGVPGTAGKEKRDIDTEERFLVDRSSFHDGWMCWKGGKPVARRLYPVGTPYNDPDFSEHGPFNDRQGEGWKKAKRFLIRSLDDGTQYDFTVSSVSAVFVVADLQREIVEAMFAGTPSFPVVTFDRTPFVAHGQKNPKPVITIDGWLADD